MEGEGKGVSRGEAVGGRRGDGGGRGEGVGERRGWE